LNNPVEIASNGLIYAKENGFNYVIIDTAGRLHIDTELMEELKNINQKVKPNEILLVVDSMTGQDAINVINGFNESLPLTGAVLTKLDGDTRGGAALSIRHLTNIPIKFIGVSEKMDGLEEFYPDRMATRILGMGDLMSMLEKAESVIDEKEALEATKKMQNGKFDLEDFLSQFKAIKKMGPLENIIKMLPNAKKMGLTDVKVDPKDMAHVEAIILSMTPYERRHPDILKATRKVRIANGSGRSVEEVNRLLKQFEQMKLMMKQFKNGNFKLPF
ncbi:MAG: signal recognition particle protein, partial [Bacilli bacterium]